VEQGRQEELDLDIPSGKTLLIDGPASVKLVEGKGHIYGCPLRPRQTYVLRPWKRYPLYAEKDVKIELNLGADAEATLAETGEEYAAWREIVENIGERAALAVCGGVDTGKTSFATFAANMFVQRLGRCVVVGLDPGQTSFTPPCVVGCALLREPVHDLTGLTAFLQRPVGSPSAALCAAEIAEAAREIAQAVSSEAYVVDVDGWVEGPVAVAHKVALVKLLNCSHVVLMGENKPLAEALSQTGVEVFTAPISRHVKQRETATRRKTREWLYRKHLAKTRTRLIPYSWVKLFTFCGQMSPQELVKQADEALAQTRQENSENKRKGLIAFLYDGADRYRGMGLLTGFNEEKRVYMVLTAVEDEVRKIGLGRVILTEDGDEVLQLD